MRRVLTAVVLALVLAGLIAAGVWHKGQVRDAVAAMATDLDRAMATIDGYAQASDGWERIAADALDELSDCNNRWAAARADALELQALQEQADVAREQERRAWAERWEQRPASCNAALLDMEAACTDTLGAIQ